MRWAALLLVSCAASHVDEIPIARLPALPPAQEVKSLHCRIDGSGEIDPGEERPFIVHDSEYNHAPLLSIRARAQVHVTWSGLPVPSRDPARRARVEIGGQHWIRASGYSDLAPRKFQIARRANVESDRVWIRGGSTVTLLGEDDANVIVEVPSEIEDPAFIRGKTACANVQFVPDHLPSADAPPTSNEQAMIDTIALHADPSDPKTLATYRIGYSLEVSVLERKGEWVHVTGSFGQTSFDGWLDKPKFDEDGFGEGGLGLVGLGAMGYGTSHWIVIDHDERVFLGPEGHIHPTSAVLEQGAQVYLSQREGNFVSFTLIGREIEPPEGQSFYIERP